MKQAIQTSVVYSISVAICGTILLLFGAAPIVQFLSRIHKLYSLDRHF
ncbi:hypothetical protein [Aerococcus suis]